MLPVPPASAHPGPTGVRLSIGYGTANTVAVAELPSGQRRTLLFDGSPLLPSGVFAETDGRLLAGTDAVRAAAVDPAGFPPYPRNRIDERTVRLGDRPYAPAELIAATLTQVHAEARRLSGAAGIEQVVLTHPIGWGTARREVLRSAAAAAGLPLPILLAAPIAVAGYWDAKPGHGLPVGRCVVVCDLDAGSFEACVVRGDPAGPQPLAHQGSDVGGPDETRLPGIIELTLAAVRAARVEPADVVGFVLAGDAGRTPLFAERVHQAAGFTPITADQPETTAAYGALDVIPPPRPAGSVAHPGPAFAPPVPGRPRRRRLLVGTLAGAMALLVVLAGIGAAVAFWPDAADQDPPPHHYPTYQRLLYRQFCHKLDSAPLAETLGRADPESTGGRQDRTGFNCVLPALKNSHVNDIQVRVSYFATSAEARASTTTAYHRVAHAGGVHQLRHVSSGDVAFAFTCPGRTGGQQGCDAANSATSVTYPFDRPDNFAFVSVATGNVRITATANDASDQLTGTVERQVLNADIAFIRANLRLLRASSTFAPTFLTGHQDEVHSLAFSPDGATLASGDDSGSIRLWNVATGRTATNLDVPEEYKGIVFSLAFSPDGRTLASGGGSGTILLWDVGTGRRTATLASSFSLIESLAFSPDGRTLASSGDINDASRPDAGAIRLWDIATRHNTATFADAITNSVAFSPDGTSIAGDSRANGIDVWNVATGHLTTYPGDGPVVFSPDGKTLASTLTDNYALLWKVH